MEYKNIKRKLAKAPKYSTLTGKEPAVCRPVRLQHTDEDVFGAYVLSIRTGNEVSFCRLAPNPVIDELWCETMDDMNNFYRENEAQLKPVETLEKDRLYAVKTSNELWARALFSEFDETGDANFEMVDGGFFKTVSPSAVYPLECRFGIFPCQATRCVLYGLEYLTFVLNKVAIDAVLEHLVGKSLIASIVTRKPKLTVVFFKPPVINLNEFILLQVAKSVRMIPLTDNEPNVPEDPLIEDPCIADRTKASVMDGLIFIAGLKCSQRPPASEVTVDGLYLGYNAKEGWSRMRLESSIVRRRKVQVRMIDYGNTVDTVWEKGLWDLNEISPDLASIPVHQSVVLPLSCLCARVISLNEIDVQSTPATVQSFARRHLYPY